MIENSHGLSLRSLQLKDLIPMKEWMMDPEIQAIFRERFNDFTDDQIVSFIINSETDKNIHRAIVDETDEYLGTISLKNIDLLNSNAEYAIVLRKTFRGNQVAGWATKQILKIAFNQLQLNKVYLNVLSENLRAIRFYEKFGFRFEGQFVEHIIINGVFKDLRWYAMTRQEFFNKGA